MIEYINNRFVWRRTTTDGMERIYADIELLNSFEVAQALRNNIGEDKVKKIALRLLVDSSCDYLCINENIQEILQLRKVGSKRLQLANRRIVTCDLVTTIELRFKNLITCCNALVLPLDSEPLLGYFPLQSLNVIIDPNTYELIENPHPLRI